MAKSSRQSINLTDLFLELQKEMIAGHRTQQQTPHPGAKGAATEILWGEWLQDYLPNRYQVQWPAFVLDVDGAVSDEIDVVVFDRQYTPFLFKKRGVTYIPAEGVYAVFEVKPALSAENIRYAGGKAASVRRLRRTSAKRIPHMGGVYDDPKPPQNIIAGLLTIDCQWKNENIVPNAEGVLDELSEEKRLDLVCSLEHGALAVTYPAEGQMTADFSDKALIAFFLKLLWRLQQVGTVVALDFDEYSKWLKE